MTLAAPTQTDLSVFVQHLAGERARLDLAVDGITCAACIREIEEDVAAEPGVAVARVNFTECRLAVEWPEGAVEPQRIVDRLARAGYRAYPFDPRRAESEETRASRELLRALAVAAFATMNVMMLSVAVWSGNASDITPETRDFFHWLSALIAIPAVAYAGRPFFRQALRALAARRLDMDVPISLGVLLAVGLSIVETIHHGTHAYFDSAVMLLTFLLAGRYLDQTMRRRTRAVAANIAALKAETAVRFVGAELVEVPVAAIRPGDLVLVRPGERIGVDGRVEDGRSEVDQSLVTGETRPQAVAAGDPVYAGTLNGLGTLRIRVATAAGGTLLDEVTRLIDTANTGRSHYLRLADRAARLYSPVVHLAALLTFAAWIGLGASWQTGLTIAITVLIITCPCALGLAVPAVQVVAAGALFRHRVLLNAGDAIERLGEADMVVFDKTGTLTVPDPRLVVDDGIDPAIRVLAARLALASSHPLARALAGEAGRLSPPEDARETPGQGVTAMIDGVEARLGSPAFCGLERLAAAKAAAHPEAALIAFRHGETVAVLAVEQTLRPDARATVEAIRAMGLDIAILSGDRAAPVAKAAEALGITRYEACLKPADKIARLEAWKAEGRKVLMVGDGLNDAPALAGAHVSLSPVTAVQLAQASADAVFLGDGLGPVASALTIARRARALMRENLWIAVVYNLIAVPVAMIGLVTPLIAALAMSGSSVIVTANALRADQGRAKSDTSGRV